MDLNRSVEYLHLQGAHKINIVRSVPARNAVFSTVFSKRHEIFLGTFIFFRRILKLYNKRDFHMQLRCVLDIGRDINLWKVTVNLNEFQLNAHFFLQGDWLDIFLAILVLPAMGNCELIQLHVFFFILSFENWVRGEIKRRKNQLCSYLFYLHFFSFFYV